MATDKTTQKEYLQDLILEVMQTNETSAKIEQSSLKMNNYLNDINANAYSSFEVLNDIAAIMSGNNLAELEKAREEGKSQQRIIDALEDVRDNTKKEKTVKDSNLGMGGILGILAGLTAFLGGFMIGYIKQFKDTTVAFFKLFTGVFKMFTAAFSESTLGKKLTAVITSVMKSVNKVFDSIKAVFKSSGKDGILSKIKGMFNSVKNFFMIPIDNVSKEFKLFKDAFGPTLGKLKALIAPIFGIGARLDDVSGAFKTISNGIKGMIGGAFAKIQSVIKMLGGIGGAGGMLGKVGMFLGKIFAPITFILTLIETVKGAMAGYDEGGILGAIKGALVGFLSAFVGEMLNMVKGAISWIAGMLGFENVSAALDSFDFMELIKGAVMGIWDWFSLLFTNPGEALSSLWNNLVGEGGLMDLLFAPIDALIDWVTKALGFREEDAPKFSLGDVFRSIWNTIIDWVASIVEKIPLVGGKGASYIRELKAGTASVDLGAMGAKKAEKKVDAEVEKAAEGNDSGDSLNNSTAGQRNTETAAKMVQDTAMMNAGEAGSGGSGGGGSSPQNTTNTVMNISNGKLPDRTDWTVGGGWGVAP
jgi:hypothetical protein